MAIKLYKSQLTPTTDSSNVLDQRQINLSEAQSIGKAMKGFLKSGENLYIKHQQITSENDLLEKKKTIMNGSDTEKGLSAHKLIAANMANPDDGIKYFNNEVNKVKDTTHEFKGIFAKKYFNNWIKKQELEDTNEIRISTTKNLIEDNRNKKLDYIETLKKKIIFSQDVNTRTSAEFELKELLDSKGFTDLFGEKVEEIKRKTAADIAFYGYKNVPIDQREGALAVALKDDRIDKKAYDDLKKHFETSSSTSTKFITSELTKMNTMVEKDGIMPDLAVLESYEATGKALGKPEIELKAQKIKAKMTLVQSLNVMTPTQIQNFITETRAAIFKDTDGTSTVLYDQLKTAENYHASLVSDLDKDPIMAVSKRGTFEIETIDFNEFASDPKGNFEAFAASMTKRKSQAEAIGTIYGVESKFLSETEATQITSVLKKMDNPEQIKYLSQILVEGFGDKAPDIFAELQEKDAFLAHIGGLSIVSNGAGLRENKAIDLAIDGYLLNKNKNLDIKVKDSDNESIKGDFKHIFPGNKTTFDSIVGTANNIYASLFYNSPKYGKGVFDKNLYRQAMEMAIGKNGDYGGVAEYNGKAVHVPMWLKNDDFDDFVSWIKENPAVLADASGSMIDGKWHPGDAVGRKTDGSTRPIQIFEGGDPYLISVGYGKYKVAIGNHPTDKNADPKYVQDGNFSQEGNNFFIIDFNKIRSNWESMKK
jgi:hypothetical protein